MTVRDADLQGFGMYCLATMTPWLVNLWYGTDVAILAAITLLTAAYIGGEHL